MSADMERLERFASAAVAWYWTCVHGASPVDTPEHRSLLDAIETVVAASMPDAVRTWTRAEPAPDDLRRVEVEGHGEWVRELPGGQLFRHVGDVYKMRRLHGLRELGTVREVKS